MYCKNCGEEIDDKAAICVKCGVYIEEKKKKNVTFAFIWSFLIAGAGQCYNGEWGKGALIFIICEVFGFTLWCIALAWTCDYLMSTSFCIGVGYIFIFVVWIASMIDAVSVAQKINKGE